MQFCIISDTQCIYKCSRFQSNIISISITTYFPAITRSKYPMPIVHRLFHCRSPAFCNVLTAPKQIQSKHHTEIGNVAFVLCSHFTRRHRPLTGDAPMNTNIVSIVSDSDTAVLHRQIDSLTAAIITYPSSNAATLKMWRERHRP